MLNKAMTTGEQLFEQFIAHRITVDEIAKMDFGDLMRQIAEMRQDQPDDLGLSDMEIAMRIQDYAQSEAGM